jgi:hypothetical protein
MPSDAIGLSPPSASAGLWSPALRLMFRPTAEYRSQMARSRDVAWSGALATPILIAVLLGVATVRSATGRVTFGLLISGMICWSFVPILQLGTAAAFIRSRTSSVSFARAIDLWFLAHAPWSIWILVVAVLMSLMPVSIELTVVSGLIPTFWTASILTAFFREVCGRSRLSARRRTVAHQAITWMLILTYIELATATSTRIIGAVQP